MSISPNCWTNSLTTPNTQAILLCLEALPVGAAGTSVEIARSFLSAARAAARESNRCWWCAPVVAAIRSRIRVTSYTTPLFAGPACCGCGRCASCAGRRDAGARPAGERRPVGHRRQCRELGLLAADTLLAEGGRLARFSGATEAALRPIVPGATPDNPLDLGRDAGRSRFAAVLDILLEAPETDGVLMLHAPNALVVAADGAAAAIEAIERYRARGGQRLGVLTCYLDIDNARAVRRRLLAARIPPTTRQTTRSGLSCSVGVSSGTGSRCWRRRRIGRIGSTPTPAPRAGFFGWRWRKVARSLSAAETSALLTMYGISPQTAASGSTAQPIVPVLLDLAVRMVVDPVFGPVLLLGLGGAPPLCPTKSSPHVAAARSGIGAGSARANLNPAVCCKMSTRTGWDLLDDVVLLLVKVACLIVDLAEIVELALNPIAVTAAGVAVGTARVRIATATEPAHGRLAIRPLSGNWRKPVAAGRFHAVDSSGATGGRTRFLSLASPSCRAKRYGCGSCTWSRN